MRNNITPDQLIKDYSIINVLLHLDAHAILGFPSERKTSTCLGEITIFIVISLCDVTLPISSQS